MKKQEVRDSFVTQLAPHLKGFLPRKRGWEFVRRFPGGRQEVGLAIVDYNPEFRVSLVFTIRLEVVQEVFHEFAETVPRYRSMTVTSTTLLDHFLPGEERKQFIVRSEEDIASAVGFLAPLLRDRIMPLFDGLQDVRSLEAVFNSEQGASFDRTNRPYRQMTALILANLAGSASLDALAVQYVEEAKFWHPDDRRRLLALVERLRG